MHFNLLQWFLKKKLYNCDLWSRDSKGGVVALLPSPPPSLLKPICGRPWPYIHAACVSVAPRIEPFSFGDPVYDGQSTQVTCFVSEGDVPLDLFWTFSGRANPTASTLRGGVSVNKMGSKVSMLYIDAASSTRHAGDYTCVAANRAGRANHTAALNVHGKTAAARRSPVTDPRYRGYRPICLIFCHPPDLRTTN